MTRTTMGAPFAITDAANASPLFTAPASGFYDIAGNTIYLLAGQTVNAPRGALISEAVACGVDNCGTVVPISQISGWATVIRGTDARIICPSCATRVFWPKDKPFENQTPILRPCPHCASPTVCGARCPCLGVSAAAGTGAWSDIFENFRRVFGEAFKTSPPPSGWVKGVITARPAWADETAWMACVLAFTEKMRRATRYDGALAESIAKELSEAILYLSSVAIPPDVVTAEDVRRLMDLSLGECPQRDDTSRSATAAILAAAIVYHRTVDGHSPRPQPFRRRRGGLPVDSD